MKKNRVSARILALGAALALAGGCSDATDVPGPQTVELNFRVTGLAAAASLSAAPGGPSMVAGPPMTLEGTNGSLTIDEIRMIINEVELELADGSCDEVDAFDDDCPEFEAPPRFLDLPLDGEPIEAVTAVIPPGTYKELDFEVEDLEDDEEDPVERAAIAAVRDQILAEISDWPEEASVMVAGTFAPTGGGEIAFRTFLEAEIEIELDLVPNLVVGEDGSASRSLTVDVAPRIWFVRPDGSLLPLHLYDFDSTGQVLEFEVEMEDGFTEIEIG